MNQIPTENDDDNRSVAASDSAQLGQPDEVPAQQEAQQHEHEQPQFGLHQNQDVVETKMMEKLKEELAKLLSTQNEQHQQEKAQLEAKNRKLGEKLSSVELQTTENGALDGRMGQLKGEFSKVLAEQQKDWMAQYQIFLQLHGNRQDEEWVFAKEGYAISGVQCRKENFQFPGTIVYYFEVTTTESIEWFSVGFTDGSKPAAGLGDVANSYGLNPCNTMDCILAGTVHHLEYPTGLIGEVAVFGCGLLLNSKNELAVFFTHKGLLMGKQIRITPTVDRLYPTVVTFCTDMEANFGDNLVAKPFKYDIGKCPGLVFE